MKILLWNVKEGISQKSQVEYFESFAPDLAIVPEIKEKNISGLSPDAAVWATNNHTNPSPKGLGILGFNGFKLEELERDEDMEIYIPLKVKNDEFSFNLLAVWNFYYACKQGRFKDVKGDDCLEWSALKHYRPFFNDPAIIVGDWNFGPTCFEDSYLVLDETLEMSGMKSLYHMYHGLPPLESKHSTFKTTRQNFHHIDHMFGSRFFLENMKSFQVDDFENVILSDHAPLVLEVKT
jgi:exonuclease III